MDCHILCYMCLTKADEVSLDNVHDVCKVSAVKRMIDRGGGNINCQDCGQNTPLHLVIQHCDEKLRLVTKLLSMGAQPNVYNGNKNTSLHLAIIYNNDERVVQMLIQHGADVHLQDVFNNTPVHLAVRLGKLKMLRLLIKAGAELDSRNLLLETPLMAAVRHSNVAAVKQLLSFGASTSVVGLNKYIALHFAARKSHPNLEIICDLMKYDSDVNWLDERYQTPIMYALEKYYDIPSDDLACTKLLIKCDVLQRLYNNQKLYLAEFLDTYSVFPELYAYFKQCVAEALRMKNQFIQDNFSFFEFAAKGLNNKALFQLTTPYKKLLSIRYFELPEHFLFIMMLLLVVLRSRTYRESSWI
ncbi:ANK_REP_REGION domain-containing protein [Caerostris extrusa]|uniref:Alpha-latrotoxin n=1 Tax=Caerostris extrusa TaxID=172846 RepID=A0AAV4UP14_CAEEX|nr:ANK_REP_REGION domain-containing protein [Caerostris extrusa]